MLVTASVPFSLRSLVDSGLFDVASQLQGCGKQSVPKRPFVGIEDPYFGDTKLIPRSQKNAALLLATSFGGDWAFIIVVPLLALQPRPRNYVGILRFAYDFARMESALLVPPITSCIFSKTSCPVICLLV